MPSDRLYSVPPSEVDYDLVRQFVLDAEAADLFTESLTFEAKEKRNGTNVIEAVSALGNTDGGIVLVGVKDRDAVGEARIVGVPQSEHDTLVNQMRNVIPHAIPEVIPVAKPGTNRLVIVLRVDADAVLHPVMVGGKVLYRLPGQKAPADRQRVIDMIARDTPGQAQSGPMQIISQGWRPQSIPLWAEDDSLTESAAMSGELRVVGGLTLPHRILSRPWLDTPAKQAAVDALNNAPLRGSPSWSLKPWLLTEARAGSLRYVSSAVPYRPVHAEAGAYLRLAGRYLALVVGFRWLKVDDGPFRLDVDTFHDALLACMVTVASTCAHVARSLNAAAPVEPRTWEAWLTSTNDNVLDVVDMGRFIRDNRGSVVGAFFPATTVRGNDLADLEQAARDWLTYWLLEIGTRGFEDPLARRAVPAWIRWPDLP
jgi:Putative DNA-binding domain